MNGTVNLRQEVTTVAWINSQILEDEVITLSKAWLIASQEDELLTLTLPKP